MSLPKDDRIFRSISGQEFPAHAVSGAANFTEQIAQALRAEFGGTHAAVKTVVQLTGANERAVKNWFEGKNGPSGVFLVALCRHSDRVLEAFLVMAGRTAEVQAKALYDAKLTLRRMLQQLDEL